MRLATRIFVGHLGTIAFSALATSLAGALLISRAVSSEAMSRVGGDLRAARTFLDDRVRLLGICADLAARGLAMAGEEADRPDICFLAGGEEAQALEPGTPALSSSRTCLPPRPRLKSSTPGTRRCACSARALARAAGPSPRWS
jgi:hypothetical protein